MTQEVLHKKDIENLLPEITPTKGIFDKINIIISQINKKSDLYDLLSEIDTEYGAKIHILEDKIEDLQSHLDGKDEEINDLCAELNDFYDYMSFKERNF